jgi:hypothetical protein
MVEWDGFGKEIPRHYLKHYQVIARRDGGKE